MWLNEWLQKEDTINKCLKRIIKKKDCVLKGGDIKDICCRNESLN